MAGGTRKRSRIPADGSAGGVDAPTPRRALVENEIFEQAARLFAERGFAETTAPMPTESCR